MFPIKTVEEIKTHILYSVIFFFRKSYRVKDNVEKYGGTGEEADNMALEHGIISLHAHKHSPVLVHPLTHPHTQTHTHIEICDIYCFFAAKVFS
jgi:hypothetical protein